MNYESGGNLPGRSRSADDIEAYARAARQREKDDQRAADQKAKEERRAADHKLREERRRLREQDRREADARREQRAKERADREAEAEAMRHQKRESAALMDAAATDMVSDTPLFFVAALDRYAQRVNHKWIYLKYDALRKMYPEFLEDGFPAAFIKAMAAEGRNFTDCTFSAGEVGEDTLNLLDRSEWIEPIKGEPHWIFATVMQSLGGDKAENIRHLEHVIYYHRMHPEYYLLPCIVLHGEGGTGKNLLVDRILFTMFPRQTVSATADNVIGDFNGLLVGMLAALVNENMHERGNMNTLKDLLHKPRMTVNIKNVPQFTADNIALYIIGVNFDSNGGVQLDRSDADRRLSVMFCERGHTLLYWIAKRQGWTIQQAADWMKTEGDQICGDPVEVGKWLNDLHRRYEHAGIPSALHGEDFHRLMEDQKRIDERMFEAVFGDEFFVRIERRILYAGYRSLCRTENMRYPLASKTLFRRAEQWLNQHKPAIILHKPTALRHGKRKTLYVWADRNHPDLGRVLDTDNATAYVAGQDSHAVWQGPELS